MIEKVINYYTVLKVIKARFGMNASISIDQALTHEIRVVVSCEGSDTLFLDSRAFCSRLSCGEVLFTDFVEIEYWVENCMTELDVFFGSSMVFDENHVCLKGFSEKGDLVMLDSVGLARVIDNSSLHFFKFSEIEEINRGILQL